MTFRFVAACTAARYLRRTPSKSGSNPGAEGFNSANISPQDGNANL
jgi:hypothetical protein